MLLDPTLRRTPSGEWEPMPRYASNEGAQKAAYLFSWIEANLYIRLKTPRKVTLPNGKTRRQQLVLLRFNPVQELLAQHLAWCWREGLKCRAWIPKGRQMGVSTFWQAVMFALCVLQEGYHALTVAHTEQSGDEIFRKARTFEGNLKDPWRKNLVNRQGGRLAWEHESSTWVATIKAGEGLSHGPTLSGIHFSEVAYYADRGVNPVAPVTAALNALADDPYSIVVYESTARGQDSYYWEGCERAKNPAIETEDQLLFLPWFLDDTYAMSWKVYRGALLAKGKHDPGKIFVPTEQETALREKLAAVQVYKGEEHWRYQHYLSDDQLVYRRWLLANKCHGKQHILAREYPNDYNEAFTSTVSCMFDTTTVAYYRAQSKAPIDRGNVIETGHTVTWSSEQKKGLVTVWEAPVPGKDYIIGADPGGNRKNSNPSAAYVVRRDTSEIVASVWGRMSWDRFASTIINLGYYYNVAIAVVENNANPAIAGELHSEGYPGTYYYQDKSVINRGLPKRPGFNTNARTRAHLIALLDKATREHLIGIPDVDLVREMPHFVWVEKDKKYRATGRHTDDRLMALSFALYVLLTGDNGDPREVTEPAEESWATKKIREIEALRARSRGNGPDKGMWVL